MTETMLAPMAKRGGTPRNIVRMGTMTTPPPNPRREPSNPARNAEANTTRKNSSGSKVEAHSNAQRRAPTSPRLESCELRGAMLPGSLSMTLWRASP